MKWGCPCMRTETDNITWGFKQVRVLETPRYFKVAFPSLLNYMTVWVKSHTGTQHQLLSCLSYGVSQSLPSSKVTTPLTGLNHLAATRS